MTSMKRYNKQYSLVVTIMNDISLTRGDTLHLQITLTDQEGEVYTLQDGDALVFTVKKNTSSDVVLIQKNILNSDITISHEDTKNMSYGTYVYDVQLTQANGDVTTVIKPSKFIITEEVNFDSTVSVQSNTVEQRLSSSEELEKNKIYVEE